MYVQVLLNNHDKKKTNKQNKIVGYSYLSRHKFAVIFFRPVREQLLFVFKRGCCHWEHSSSADRKRETTRI